MIDASWLPGIDGKFYKPSKICLDDLPAEFDKDTKDAKNLVQQLGLQNNVKQQFINSLSFEEKRRYELAEKIPIEKLEKLVEELNTAFPEKKVLDGERRELKSIQIYNESNPKQYELRERTIKIAGGLKRKKNISSRVIPR